MFVTVNGICCTDLLIDTRTKERRAHTKIHKCEYVSMLLAVKCLRASSLQFICGNSHCCSLLLQCMLQHQHTHKYERTVTDLRLTAHCILFGATKVHIVLATQLFYCSQYALVIFTWSPTTLTPFFVSATALVLHIAPCLVGFLFAHHSFCSAE